MTKDELKDLLGTRDMELQELREQLRLAQVRAADSEDKVQALKHELFLLRHIW